MNREPSTDRERDLAAMTAQEYIDQRNAKSQGPFKLVVRAGWETGLDAARVLAISEYSDAYKERNGFRPDGVDFESKSLDEIEAATFEASGALTALYEEKRKLSLVDHLSEEQTARLGEINDKLDEVENLLGLNDEYDAECDFDDPMDGDHESALASAGFGTDEDYGYFGGGDDW